MAAMAPASSPPTASATPLLDPEFMHKLEQLELVSRKIIMGRMKGERKSKRRGSSVEFAEHRNYSVGDDLRHIDWNVYGRLDKLFLEAFPGRRRPARLHASGHKPVHGLRHADQAALRQAGCRGLGVHRAGQPRSGDPRHVRLAARPGDSQRARAVADVARDPVSRAPGGFRRERLEGRGASSPFATRARAWWS